MPLRAPSAVSLMPISVAECSSSGLPGQVKVSPAVIGALFYSAKEHRHFLFMALRRVIAKISKTMS